MEDRHAGHIAPQSLSQQDATPSRSFLLQSTSFWAQDLLKTADTGLSTRQKRRRTSPQDHAILEAAYLKNSKPDKNERAEIVGQVALGEKEVQIWFQNRRQNDRRKSRPLLPHELVPHFRNGVPTGVLQCSPGPDTLDSQQRTRPLYPSEYDVLPNTSSGTSGEDNQVHSRASSIHELLNPPSPTGSSTPTSLLHMQDQVEPKETPPSSFERSQEGRWEAQTRTQSGEADEDTSAVGYSSSGKKRAHEEMTGRQATQTSKNAASMTTLPGPSPTIRLSMTAEGAVKVRMTDRETPSPPKERAPTPLVATRIKGSLQRSKSAAGAADMGAHCSQAPSINRVADGKLGRSRDARTWEFYCDTEARETLSEHAEHERSGSAIGAINLIRSQSARHRSQMLAPVATRLNVSIAPLGSTNRRKPKFSRAKSSMGRMENMESSAIEVKVMDRQTHKAPSPSGDSDKENWAPGTRLSQHPLRHTQHSASGRSILANNDRMLSHTSDPTRNNIAKAVVNVSLAEREDNRYAAVKEKAKGSDLDCVQGLLSLSQGAWR